MLSLWEDLLILRAKWEERMHQLDGFQDDPVLKKAHDELDKLIKQHTRVKTTP